MRYFMLHAEHKFCTTLTPPWFLYNPYIPPLYLLVSPSFFTCCQHVFIVRKRANCLAPHQCTIFGTLIIFVPALLNS